MNKSNTNRKTGKLAIHKLAQLFPMLSSKEYKELADDIRERGIAVPILVNKEEDTIIDGRNRYWIALENNIAEKDIPKEVFDGKDEDIPKEILSRNLFRRHLTDKQRVSLVTKLRAPQLEAEARERQREGGRTKLPLKSTEAGEAAQQIAKEAKVSVHQARQALKARKAGLLDEVYEEKKSLKAAAKSAPKKPKKPAAPKKLEDVVWEKFSRWLKNNWSMTKHDEVKQILLGFIKLISKYPYWPQTEMEAEVIGRFTAFMFRNWPYGKRSEEVFAMIQEYAAPGGRLSHD